MAKTSFQVAANNVGVLTVSETTSWNDLTSDDFEDFAQATGNALAASLVYVSVQVRNTHASQTLFVMLGAGTGATTNRLPVAAGDVQNLDLYGLNATILSLQGSAATTTGHVLAHFATAGDG